MTYPANLNRLAKWRTLFATKWLGQTEGIIHTVIPGEDPWTQHAYIVTLPNGLTTHFYPDELEEAADDQQQ